MIRIVAIAAFAFASLALGSEAEALSCQRRIVSHGDVMSQVQALCGDPASRTSRLAEQSRSVFQPGPGGAVIANTITVTTLVETWVYDFGPRRLMQELVFEDGRLRRIRTLSYGTPNGREASMVRPDATALWAWRRA